jgi:hypothetical protein
MLWPAKPKSTDQANSWTLLSVALYGERVIPDPLKQLTFCA